MPRWNKFEVISIERMAYLLKMQKKPCRKKITVKIKMIARMLNFIFGVRRIGNQQVVSSLVIWQSFLEKR